MRENLQHLLRRSLLIAAVSAVTAILLPLQELSVILRLRSARWIPLIYHRVICSLIGVTVRNIGNVACRRPLLLACNHSSWLDVLIIGSVIPVVFVAKREVASWPLFGRLASLQPSVFVDRSRPLEVSEINGAIAQRLLSDDAVVIFPEGTSSDGTEVLPFRSALIGAARDTLTRSPFCSEIHIQPVSLVYVSPNRRTVAWARDDDLTFIPHLLRVLGSGPISAILTWGDPIPYRIESDRKIVAQQLEHQVRELTINAHKHDE